MELRIQQLPEIVANQIAAGEVIERPASVVKELLENALDAKADAITIDIGFGGLNYIKISDNGCGIIAEDLPLAIAPHATSKISQLADLYAIQSLGFRGEALASIASIAKLIIRSKPKHQTHAMELKQTTQELKLTPCARNHGTTVEVHDIFYNAPVRKKFLKSEKSEFLAIEAVVKRFAMSAPKIALELRHNDKLVLSLPAATTDKLTLTRIGKLLGNDFIKHALSLHVTRANFALTGWLGHPDYQRNQMDKQWVYINGRMVKDKLINHALKQAYETYLHPGKHPACLLYFTIAPAELDVNVHPTKHEVRFSDPRLVHDFFVSEIAKCLNTVQQAAISANKQNIKLTPYQPKSPKKSTDIENFFELDQAFTITAIDEQLVLIELAQQIYLLDWFSLQDQWLQEKLQSERRPFASRPLLVPIRHHMEQVSASAQNLYNKLLADIGIKIEWRNLNEVVIRSLPLLAAELDVNQLLSAIFALPTLNSATVLTALRQSIRFACHAKYHPDWPLFLDYIKHNLTPNSKYCKHLSADFFRGLLNE